MRGELEKSNKQKVEKKEGKERGTALQVAPSGEGIPGTNIALVRRMEVENRLIDHNGRRHELQLAVELHKEVRKGRRRSRRRRRTGEEKRGRERVQCHPRR